MRTKFAMVECQATCQPNAATAPQSYSSGADETQIHELWTDV